ncbi:MAG: DUF3604 domain-containing protein [Myxococcota bacterium]
MISYRSLLLPLSLVAVPLACDAVDASATDARSTPATAPDTTASLAAASAPAAIPVDPAGLVAYTEDREPCADRNPLRNAYYGDLHVHTRYSFDAYLAGTSNDPFDAYTLAQADPVNLDFAGVTDHGEYLGETQLCTTPGSPAYDSAPCAIFRSNADVLGFATFGLALAQQDPDRSETICGPDDATCLDAAGDAWSATQLAAELAYDRSDACEFTSFVAYEYTGTTGGANLHRNVVFRNGNVPALPTSYFEAPVPQQLWQALEADCLDAPGGCDVLAIPHNSNASNGQMFALTYPDAADVLEQAEQASRRAALEPLMEIIQHKGASECRPGFSADEYCDFELLDEQDPCNGDGSGSGLQCAARSDYLRGALAGGLAEGQDLGINPLKLGVIASTDTHNGVPGVVDESQFEGHVGDTDDRRRDRLNDVPTFGPGGLAGVWAVENSRDAIFEAMQRRETFGTSGPRIAVRLFGGWDFEPALCSDPNLLEVGYAQGVPMGSDLDEPPVQGAQPRFVLVADQDQVPLQRAHIIKIWVDAQGQTHEEVYPLAGGDNDASVDPATCEPTGSGADTLCGVWTDTNFDPTVPAVYYARVLENPTCRWSAYDCNSFPALTRPRACDDVAQVIQERAWTSPVWYGGSL